MSAREGAVTALWEPGDRVEVRLRDPGRPVGRGYAKTWFAGTVRVSEPTGVIVDLDIPVNGASGCYATQGELRAEGGAR